MINLNTAELERMGRALGDSVVKRASLATRLDGLSAEDRLSGLSAEEVVPHLKVEDIWASLSPEERQKLMELGRAN